MGSRHRRRLFLLLCFTQRCRPGAWAEAGPGVGRGDHRDGGCWSSETDPVVWGWCAPRWAFLPWRQAKQQCRSRSVVEGRRGLEKGWLASCCFLMSKGKSTWFSTGSFDVITCLSAWHGLAQLQHEFHNSFAGFINPQLLECRDSVTPSWISNQSGDQLEAVGCLLPLGPQRLASQIPGAGVLSPFSCVA